MSNPVRTPTPFTFEQLNDMLNRHTWADPKADHSDYWRAMKSEASLFKVAQSLGGRGVEIFRQAHWAHIEASRQAEYDKAYEASRLGDKRIVDFLKKQLEETRNKYMKPIDFFKEKLEKHDWYYQYSDDINVYRAGKTKEEEINKAMEQGGEEFRRAFNEYRMKKNGN